MLGFTDWPPSTLDAGEDLEILYSIKKVIEQKGWVWTSQYAPIKPHYVFKIRSDWLPSSDRNNVSFGTSSVSEVEAAMEAMDIANLEY